MATKSEAAGAKKSPQKSAPKAAAKKAAPRATKVEEKAPVHPEPVPSTFAGFAATAELGTVVVPTKVNDQMWYSDLAGQEVPVVRVTFNPPHEKEPVTVLVYDGDGSGTAKFIDGTGTDHLEIQADG